MELELHQDKDLLNTITRSTQTEDQNSPSDIVKVIKNVCSRKSIELESTDVELFLMSTKLTDMAMEQITKIIERQRFLTTDLSRCGLFCQNLSLRSSEDYIAINLL